MLGVLIMKYCLVTSLRLMESKIQETCLAWHRLQEGFIL